MAEKDCSKCDSYQAVRIIEQIMTTDKKDKKWDKTTERRQGERRASVYKQKAC